MEDCVYMAQKNMMKNPLENGPRNTKTNLAIPWNSKTFLCTCPSLTIMPCNWCLYSTPPCLAWVDKY